MKKDKLQFKANAGLKDIIGRELIYNDNIAIIELVKNSKDANSKKVELEFINRKEDNADKKIIIRDYGCGMSLFDIKNKWLNIAYSEKKNKKNINKFYAGNKGVGRFSCDRLGETLVLYTKSKNEKAIKLTINWLDFENKGINDQIKDIDVYFEYLSDNEFYNLSGIKNINGTTLEVINLRSDWNENKYKKLIKELELFIADPNSNFKVFLDNKEIKNNVLEKLSFKTTHIKSDISKNGEEINTSLYYQGEKIYSYVSENNYKNLKDIKLEIHYLDTPSKISFKHYTGVRNVEYGSAFLFYNGFRISPYGNEGNDWLGLDKRKAQGTRRYFGTREIFGRIDINDEDSSFSVLSNREGMAKNIAFHELTADDKDEKVLFESGKSAYGYIQTIVRELERFVVTGLNWDRFENRLNSGEIRAISEGDLEANNSGKLVDNIDKVMLMNTVNNILKLEGIKVDSILINKDVIDRVFKIKEEKFKKLISNITDVNDQDMADLSSKDVRKVNQIINIFKEKAENAELIRDDVEKEVKEIKKELRAETKKRLFAQSNLTTDSQRVGNLEHLIGIYNGEVNDDLKSILTDIKNGNIQGIEDIVPRLENSYFLSTKVQKLSAIITKVNFNIMTDSMNYDIFSYIKDYVEEMLNNENTRGLNINFVDNYKKDFLLNFSPLDVSMLIDNIINNSIKAKASRLDIIASKGDGDYCIEFIDDGVGLTDKYKMKDLFDRGITTTDGAGIGLNHVKDIVKDLDANVGIYSNKNKGVNLKITWV